MKEKIAKLLTNYAHQRGGVAVNLTDPVVANEIAAEIESLIKAENAAAAAAS